MSYTKNTWTAQELITADKLNNIETGVNDTSENVNRIYKYGDDSITALNVDKLSSIDTTPDGYAVQETIIDPRSGYKYVFANSSASDSTTGGDTEDLLVYEYDQFNRMRSSMKVVHGTNKKTWLHGQFEQFNYYNTDETKVEFLVGNYGDSLKLEYKPNTTVNADDLPVFFTVNQSNSHSQVIDFENDRVYAALFTGGPTDKNYNYDFYEYDLLPDSGTLTFITNYTVTVSTSLGIIHQGLSAAPANAFINGYDGGTILFNASGYMVGTSPNEMSIRAFVIKDKTLHHVVIKSNLNKGSFLSTSQHRLSDLISYRNGASSTYKELEGSSVVKIGNDWVNTTNLYYDTSSLADPNNVDRPMVNRYKGAVLLGFGVDKALNKVSNLGNHKPWSMGIDIDVTSLSDVLLEGHYTLGSRQIGLYDDVPTIFKGVTDANTVIGGDGIEEVILNVEKVTSQNRVKQTLEIYAWTRTMQQTLTFTRTIRVKFAAGSSNVLTVGEWIMTPINPTGTWTPFPTVTNSKNATIPNYRRYVITNAVSTFFAGDNNAPTVAGFFEVLPYEIALEGENTSRIMQRFTTFNNPNLVYSRVVTVNVDTSTKYPMGLGGGRGAAKSVTDWNILGN